MVVADDAVFANSEMFPARHGMVCISTAIEMYGGAHLSEQDN